MADPNLFAVLTAYDNKNLARDAFGLPANIHCFRKAAEGIAEEPTIDSREPTPAPQPSPEAQCESGDRILLRLDKPPKDSKTGWKFGTDPRVSDVLLGHRGTSGISSSQFYITITEQFHVELHERSRYGTVVSYDGQAKNVILKDDKRLLSFEPGAQKQWKDIIVYVPDANGLAFKIEFPSHRVGGSEYRENLRAFFKGCNTALPSVSGLGLDSNPPTAPPSRQPRTPCKLTVYFDDGEIGRGEYGLVRKYIDMRAGKFYAAKKFNSEVPTRPSGKKRKLDEDGWFEGIRNEVAIMKKNPHLNIMPVIDFQEKPEPLLLMPYYPLGNLEKLRGVEPPQYVSAFRQMLLGLRHLHERGVVHRDLKPANLLVAKLHPFTIVISDFGFSRLVARNDLLKTFCGSKLYAAPDVVPVGKKCHSEGYGHSVDIWSAGIIMLEFIFGRPNHAGIDHLPLTDWIKMWSDIVVMEVAELDENSDKVIDILKNMLTKEPEDRFTADECLRRGCENGLFRRLSDGRIVDAGDTSEGGANEVAPDAETEIAIPGAEIADDSGSDDGTATPRQQLPQRTGTGTPNPSEVPTILLEDLWDDDESDGHKPADGQLAPTSGSNSGPSTHRLKVSHQSSWSLTIGLGHSDSDGGFDVDDGGDDWNGEPATGLFIRRDRFTSSLQNQFAADDDSQEEEEGGVGQGFLMLREPESEIAEHTEPASFDKRLLKLLA